MTMYKTMYSGKENLDFFQYAFNNKWTQEACSENSGEVIKTDNE